MVYHGTVPLKNLVIYEIYVRNHSALGNFHGVEKDIPRIRSLGVDVVWFMPLHPIGKVKKKGSLGCPYSISDYRTINPEYGTLDDFKRLIKAIHKNGMQVMVDVVFNHTAHDSMLVKDHPEYFHQDKHGNPITTVPDWSDVIDLKQPNRELTRYLADTLAHWSKMGVDGFRCDVASLVPISVWEEIRSSVDRINPNTIWLAESVHAGFVEYRRTKGLTAHSDSELYQQFDLTYDYDIWPMFQAVVTGKEPVERLLEMVRFQHAIYPTGYTKMHYVENHDQARIMFLAQSENQAKAWTAFQAFNPGAFLIYAGQEAACKHTPSLFDRDLVDWNDFPLQEFLTRICRIKKNDYMNGEFILSSGSPVIQAAYVSAQGGLLGIFNVSAMSGKVPVPVMDGAYTNLLGQSQIHVLHGMLDVPEAAIILEVPTVFHPARMFSSLIDVDIKPG